jgi:hypothetical protein
MTTPIRVYCDTGRYRPELPALGSQGHILVMTYGYENSTRKLVYG